MVRATMILLCFLLLAAAAGRYKAEVSVREAREELENLDRAKADELSEVKMLRAEVAFLESPDRLAKIAARHTDLAPLTGAQLLTADEFLLALAGPAEPATPQAPATDVIAHALAMADLSPAR
jgi:hypothetical protein